MQFGPETQTECDIRRAKTGHSSAPKTSHRVGGVLGGRIVLFGPVGKGHDQVEAV